MEDCLSQAISAAQSDRFVDPALPFPDGGEQVEGVGRFEAEPVAGVAAARQAGDGALAAHLLGSWA
ncbi:hypothetical protein [Kitasatospora sp. NPDC097691]|uniref:hypothetical protein n=1 Tax=Kitasatospora sp. NPDC097691 TaxID=3157231 RepID=UPI003321DD2F